jgi:hypothetical protein
MVGKTKNWISLAIANTKKTNRQEMKLVGCIWKDKEILR